MINKSERHLFFQPVFQLADGQAHLLHTVPIPYGDAGGNIIGGRKEPECDILEPYRIGSTKGGGSAYGGKWRPNPNKPEDNRLIGTPGEIKTTVDKHGNIVQDKIGDSGYAIMERHNTDHGGNRSMMDYPKAFSDANFDGISDFKECMRCGGEVQFLWRGTMYSVSGNVGNNEDGTRKMLICQSGTAEVNEKTAKWCSNADEILEYMVGEDRLRDVITKVEVYERTI